MIKCVFYFQVAVQFSVDGVREVKFLTQFCCQGFVVRQLLPKSILLNLFLF